jgi:hypothetical protein
VAKVSKEVQGLFLRFLNLSPGLLAEAQEEAKLQNTGIDVLIRDALEKHLKGLKAAHQKEKAEAETIEYARLILRAHFAEDRNEFLAEDAIRRVGK